MHIFGQHLPQRVPGTHIRPARLQRDHHARWQGGGAGAGCVGGQALHHRVVDRVAGAGGKQLFAHAHKLAVGLAHFPGGLAGGQNVGAAVAQRRQPDGGAHHEQATVPQVVARIQIGLGGGLVGFFNKTGNGARVGGGVAAKHLSALDVAIAGFRGIGCDAKGDHGAGCGQRCTLAHHLLERRHVGDDMVSRHHQQHRVSGAFDSCKRSQGKGWSRISSTRLEHHRTGLLQQAQLLGNDKTVFLVAHHHRWGQGDTRCAGDTAHGGLQ